MFTKGDIITAYKSGIHEFIRYRDFHEQELKPGVIGPLVVYRQLYTACGKPRKSKKDNMCHAVFCQKAEIHIKGRLLELEEEKVRLNKLLGQFNK